MLLLLIAVPAIILATVVHDLLRAHAPSNILIRHVHASRPTLSGSATLVALAVACLIALHLLTRMIESGAAGWLNLVVLVLAWDAIKFVLIAAIVATRAALILIQPSRTGAPSKGQA